MSKDSKVFLWKSRRTGLFFSPFLCAGLFLALLTFPNTGHCIEKLFQISSIINNERILQHTDGHSVFPLSDGYLVHSGLYPGEWGGTGTLNFTKFGLKGQIEFSRDFYSGSNGLFPFRPSERVTEVI